MKTIISVLILILTTSLCFGATIHVPGDSATIQAGIDGCVSGDTVVVAPDTYTGDGNRDIDFGGKSILLLSAGGAASTIIDCDSGPGDAHWAFYFHNGEDSNAVVSGFTITDAFTDEQGAVQIEGSSPTIRNCVITENDCNGIRVQGSASYPKIDNCEISNNTYSGISLSDVLYPSASIELTNSLVVGNAVAGIYIYSPYHVIITNCTFVGNGQFGAAFPGGIFIEGDPPKDGGAYDPDRVISNCIVAYNNGMGIRRIFFDSPYYFYCNNSFGNEGANYSNVDAYPNDPNSNISLPPLFCEEIGDYSIHEQSPCAPDYNDCSVLIGARGIGCDSVLCSDINGDNHILTVGDLVLLVRYVMGQTYLNVPPYNADLTACGGINMSDVGLFIQYFIWGPPWPFCEPLDPCYLPTGDNAIALGCPVEIIGPMTDSVPLPIYITNDTTLVSMSLGFSYNSDFIEILSIDTTGSILPDGWDAKISQPTDSYYVYPVSDSNIFMLMVYKSNLAVASDLTAQEDGLLATLWIELDSSAMDYEVDFDTAFFQPAGEFIFTHWIGKTILPQYIDCGTEDLIVTDYICGDADLDGQVDVDDVVRIVECIFFIDCIGFPIETMDVNCSGNFDIDDVVYLVGFIFAGGPWPCDMNGDGEPDC